MAWNDFVVARGACCALGLCALLWTAARAAEAPPAAGGVIEGVVRLDDGEPAAYLNVIVPVLQRGTMTDEHGRYRLAVPAGTWEVVVRVIGRDPVKAVVVVARGGVTRADLRVGEARVVRRIDEVVVRGRRNDVQSSSTRHAVDPEAIRTMRPDGMQEMIAKQAGVTAAADGLHVRGGRSDEIKVRLDGVEITDPLRGRSGELPLFAVAGADVITGGLDAEYGDALSGIVNLTTREGGPKFSGDLRWDTDRYGDPTKTYEDLDRLALGGGGPTPWRRVTWFATWEGAFSRGWLPTALENRSRTVLDFVQVGFRPNNRMRTTAKLAWTPAEPDHVTLERTTNRSVTTPYDHMWSRRGWVRVVPESVRTAAGVRVQPRWGSWAMAALDSTYEAMNMAEHVPTTDDRFEQWGLSWRHTWDTLTVTTARLGTVAYDTRTAVRALDPWAYDTVSPFYWSGNQGPGTEDNPFFATHGDYPLWERRSTRSATLKLDGSTRHWRQHLAKAGIEARTSRVRNLSLGAPNAETGGLPGGSRSEYDHTYPEASAYVQDRWTFEGLVLNAGLRWDLFSPGDGIPDDAVPNGRWKAQWSPRLGVAYPVSNHDALSFHYAWRFQTPTRSYVFESRSPRSGLPVRGNPDLEPQTNVEYQAALTHLFTREVNGSFALFYKDIFGLITARSERDADGNQVARWKNGDYASVRGFEATLARTFDHRLAGEIAYTYMLATGVASDPASALQFYNGGRLYLPISEQSLNWDERQRVTMQATFRERGHWGMNLSWTWGSGRPFTPAWRDDRRSDPKWVNSRRLPGSSTLDWSGDRDVRVWGRDLTLFVDARNVLDTRSVAELAPANAANPNVDQGVSDYTAYYTETGRAGGAYLQDVNGDHVLDWVPVHDPRVWGAPRSVRVGVQARF